MGRDHKRTTPDTSDDDGVLNTARSYRGPSLGAGLGTMTRSSRGSTDASRELRASTNKRSDLSPY